MRSGFFRVCLCALLALSLFVAFSQGGPIRRLVGRLLHGPCAQQGRMMIQTVPFVPLPSCPNGLCPSAESRPAEAPALLPVLPFEAEEPISRLQGIALEPRPGTGSPLQPGSRPKAEEGLLPFGKLGNIDPGQVNSTLQQLQSTAGKVDSFLLLVSSVLTILGLDKLLPWVAPVVRGLHGLLQAASPQSGTTPPGQPAVAALVSPVAPSSISKPAG